jgi:Cd2+/Zn2+-exporting ATPase
MDCASEESEIRRAVEGVPGVLGLRFQLGERSLRIAGEPQAALAAVEAIRNTGFEVHAWPDAPESTSAGVGSDHEHEHAATTGSGLPRLLSALALATAAEGLSFLVPDAPWSKWVGLAVAAAAIALAGFSTFSKGLTALRHGRLNINALMSVAVAGSLRHRAMARGSHGHGALTPSPS